MHQHLYHKHQACLGSGKLWCLCGRPSHWDGLQYRTEFQSVQLSAKEIHQDICVLYWFRWCWLFRVKPSNYINIWLNLIQSCPVSWLMCVWCSSQGSLRHCQPRIDEWPHHYVGGLSTTQTYCLILAQQPRNGLCHAILGTLRLKVDGLLTLGPPCSSFVFINAHTSGRTSKRPYGHQHRPYVETASLNPGLYVVAILCMHMFAVYLICCPHTPTHTAQDFESSIVAGHLGNCPRVLRQLGAARGVVHEAFPWLC